MKRILLTSLVAGIAGLSVSAHATTNGVVNFNGNILGNTCTITVNGTVAPAAATVTLAPARDSDLNAAAKTANLTNFDISLTKCVVGGKASAYFEPSANTDANGRIRNTGTATNVALELVDRDRNAAIYTNTAQTTTTRDSIVSGNATLNYGVRYYALGRATTGTVRGAVTFNIIYE